MTADARISEIRKKFTLTTHALLVTSDDGGLIGILSKSDIFKPVQTRLVLVDHNELTQAVPGVEEVTITEIIDHHRLGSLHTAQPILFLNEYNIGPPKRTMRSGLMPGIRPLYHRTCSP